MLGIGEQICVRLHPDSALPRIQEEMNERLFEGRGLYFSKPSSMLGNKTDHKYHGPFRHM